MSLSHIFWNFLFYYLQFFFLLFSLVFCLGLLAPSIPNYFKLYYNGTNTYTHTPNQPSKQQHKIKKSRKKSMNAKLYLATKCVYLIDTYILHIRTKIPNILEIYRKNALKNVRRISCFLFMILPQPLLTNTNMN